MAKFVRFLYDDGSDVYLNASNIIAIYSLPEDKDYTVISTILGKADDYTVKGQVNEIVSALNKGEAEILA